MVELVRYIVSNLVDDQNFDVEEIEKEGGETELRIILPKDEMGKVIGKQGRIAKSIRTVVKAASSKSKIKYSVEICEK